MSASSGGSVTHWIAEVKAGEELALGKLHQRYWPFLVQLARKKLHGAPQRAADAEDVAQEAFWGFYKSLKQGRLPVLTNRHDLLALLVLVTARRAATQIRDEHRAKRGGGAVQGESALDHLVSSSQGQGGMALVADSGRTPQEEAILHDCYQTYTAGLPDKLRDFAELYLAGCTTIQDTTPRR